MKKLVIDGDVIETDENISILELARKNNISIPSLCLLEECNGVTKCAVCIVEISYEGKTKLSTSCTTMAEDGMVVTTNSEKVQEMVKKRISTLLDKHEFKCGQCTRRENCEFLKLVIKTKARASKPFLVQDKTPYMDTRSVSIQIDRTKCLECGRCIDACKKKTGTCTLQFERVDGKRIVTQVEGKKFEDTNCLLCGQCVAACPVAALTEKTELDKVKEAIADPNKHVVVAMAPAVRASLGELFNMGYGEDVTGKAYTALRELGFDKVFDINFGADMTIMEEATELIHRIQEGGPFPMFTSCCPGWIRQVENYYPQYLKNLSTAKSPQQIFGVATKTYYPAIANIDPKDVYTVTIMPCTAKKYEANLSYNETNGLREIDAVLTTRELAKMIKDAKIAFAKLEDSEADPAMGMYSGAGVIFGATGGVMEAALRTAKDFVENKDLKDIDYTEVRGFKGVKEATVKIGDNEYNVAVINGAKNLSEFIESGKINEKQYHFIEVMACPGGCINGGGQPHVSSEIRTKNDYKKLRASVLYNQDSSRSVAKRKSHQNPAIIKMYNDYVGKPGEGNAHELFHHIYEK